MGKHITMIVICLAVAACQTMILIMFLKKLRRINDEFWGTAAAQARADLEKAREEALQKAADEEEEAAG